MFFFTQKRNCLKKIKICFTTHKHKIKKYFSLIFGCYLVNINYTVFFNSNRSKKTALKHQLIFFNKKITHICIYKQKIHYICTNKLHIYKYEN